MVHASTRLDLALHLLEMFVHLEEVVALSLGRGLVAFCQLPVQLFVLFVVLLELLRELDSLSEAQARHRG